MTYTVNKVQLIHCSLVPFTRLKHFSFVFSVYRWENKFLLMIFHLTTVGILYAQKKNMKCFLVGKLQSEKKSRVPEQGPRLNG